MNKLKTVLVFVIVVLLVQVSGFTIKAMPLFQNTGADDGCIGLDLVLLIDQSGSMSAGYGKYPPTDPEGARVASVHHMIDLLFINRRLFCPETIHRVGVIGFGNQIVEQLPLSTIDLDEDVSKEAWEQTRNNLINKITSLNLGTTDFGQAFETAANFLAEMSPVEDGRPRKKAVIILTDGNPCIGEASKCEDGTFDPREYMRTTLVPLVNDPNGTFPTWVDEYNSEEDVYIWFIAINDGPLYLEGNEDTFGKSTGDYWREITDAHGGEVISLGQDKKNIPETYLNIFFNDLLGTSENNVEDDQVDAIRSPELIPCGEPIYVDPYVQKMIFYIYKNGAEVDVTFRSNDQQIVLAEGQTVEGPSDFIDAYENFLGFAEIYILNRPDPGLWEIERNCEDVVAYKQVLFARADLVAPQGSDLPLFDEPPYYDQDNPYYLRFKVRDGEGQPFEEQSGFPLNVLATVIQPDGTLHFENLPLKAEGGGVYGSEVDDGKGYLSQEQVGRYGINLSVETRSIDPSKRDEALVIYENENNWSYYVRQVNRFDFELISPADGGTFNLLNYQGSNPIPEPIELLVQLVDAEGNPISSDGVIFEPNQAFMAQIISPDGQIEEVPMELDAGGSGLFRAKLRNSGANLLTALPGSYTLKIELIGNVNEQDYVSRRNVAEIDITGVPVTPIDFRITTPEMDSIVPWHQSGFNISGETNPVSLEIELTDLAGTFQDAEKVIQVEPNQVFSATVTGPNEETELFEVTGKQTVEGLKFSGQTEAPFYSGGEYQIDVHLTNKQVFQAGYVPVAETETVTFNRIDSWLTWPWLWRSVAGMLGFIFVGIFTVLGYTFSGGPQGTIEFVGKDGSPIAASMTLRGWQRTNKRTVKFFKDVGYETVNVIVEKAPSWTSKMPTVSLTMEDPNTQDIIIADELQSNQEQRVSSNIRLKYKNS